MEKQRVALPLSAGGPTNRLESQPALTPAALYPPLPTNTCPLETRKSLLPTSKKFDRLPLTVTSKVSTGAPKQLYQVRPRIVAFQGLGVDAGSPSSRGGGFVVLSLALSRSRSLSLSLALACPLRLSRYQHTAASSFEWQQLITWSPPWRYSRGKSHRRHPILVAFVWELTEETIDCHGRLT